MKHVRYREILKRLSWSPQQQARYRQTRLRAVVEHAAKNVSFYEKRLRQHGLRARDLRHLKDLSLLPLTSIADLEGDCKAFLARGVQPSECASRCRARESKEALRVYLSPGECETIGAIERRIVASNGLAGRHSRLTFLPPSQMPPRAGASSKRRPWHERLLRGRRSYVSAFETPREQLRVLGQLRPDCVVAPLWILNRLEREIRNGRSPGFRLRLLLSWGEPMRQRDREALRETLGIPPTDIYQVWEFGPVAAECPQRDGLHVNFDLVHVEIVCGERTAGPGETGEVVITALANRTMPLIRYRVGDLATWKSGPCSCGWQGPVLEAVHGRLEHAVVLPPGTFVTSRQIEECLDQFTNVVAYRAIQTGPRHVEVLVVPGTLFQQRTTQLLREKCLELFNNQVGVELRVVHELPLLESQRRQSVVCKLPRI